ncbi:MAG: hypothetical protein NXI01_07895 [Gammaproteobacteria bacterium]|nr:hypothetical protein [Gammaproteobacteria bacterium]
MSILQAQTQPKFTLIPITPTAVSVPYNTNVAVQYTLTNQTKIGRNLVVAVPTLPGITQITSGVGICPNPVTLSPAESCTVWFNLNGTGLGSGRVFTQPIEVCKTYPQSTAPTPFLCSRTSLANQLSITQQRVATISESQRLLILNGSTGNTGQITVTNGSTETATNISANLTGTALESYVTQDASNCVSVAPGQSCNLLFTPAGEAVSLTRFPISGDNTTILNAAIKVINLGDAQIQITSGETLVLTEPGGTGTMTVMNNSPGITATGISATLTTALIDAGVTQVSTDCANLNYPESCTLSFTAGSTVVTQQTVEVSGSNTSVDTATITVDSSTLLALELLPPTALSFPLGSTTTQSMTIQNNSDQNVTGIAPDFSGTALNGAIEVTSNACSGTTAPGGTCVITYQLASGQTTVIPATTFPIYGNNTTTVVGTISVATYFAYYAKANITAEPSVSYSVYGCDLAPADGTLSNCTNEITSDYPLNQLVVDATNNYLYVSQFANDGLGFNGIKRYTIDTSTGSLSNEEQTKRFETQIPFGIVLNPAGTVLHISNGQFEENQVHYCDTSDFTNCGETLTGTLATSGTYDMVTNAANTYLYSVSGSNNDDQNFVGQCPINASGTLETCTASGNVLIGEEYYSIVLNPAETLAYVSNYLQGGINQCTISSYLITSCVLAETFTDQFTTGMAINTTGNHLYVAVSPNLSVTTGVPYVALCTVNGSGGLACVDSGANIGTTEGGIQGLAIWEQPSSS